MKRISSPPMDRRLQDRYWLMVKSHMHAATSLAPGVKSLAGVASAFAATQGAWRFLNNDRAPLCALAQPLREAGREAVTSIRSPFVLLAHDWCKLGFTWGKDDFAQLTHQSDVGYELTTALLVSPDDGTPLAPMEMHLRTGRGTLSTRDPAPLTQPHLEQLLPTMNASQDWLLSKPILHVIDREADSVDHYRQWDAAGHTFLIRADDRRVRWNDESRLLSDICQQLRKQKAFVHVGEGEIRGRQAPLWVAETEVVLHRPAKKNVGGQKFSLPGRKLPLRLIVVQLRNKRQTVLAEWLLLSNAPADWAEAAHLGRCYYWRWRIETFFKLLKSHGHQLEQWQQKSGPAIARRLLVAAMACVIVWRLQADHSRNAEQLKDFLIQLSGRQMKRKQPHTAPALLAGLWTWLAMTAALQQYDLSEIQQFAQSFPFDTG